MYTANWRKACKLWIFLSWGLGPSTRVCLSQCLPGVENHMWPRGRFPTPELNKARFKSRYNSKSNIFYTIQHLTAPRGYQLMGPLVRSPGMLLLANSAEMVIRVSIQPTGSKDTSWTQKIAGSLPREIVGLENY